MTARELEDARYDREFDGKPRPWVPDETDIEDPDGDLDDVTTE